MDATVLNAKIQAIENLKFTQIPGPNPLLVPGEPGSWDDGMLEMCDILKDNGKYYLYYHATGAGQSYRIGVAVSDSPLGPFVKYGDKPILDLTTFGHSSNDLYIACGTVFKEAENKYYLFYSLQQSDDQLNYYIGMATANNPLGPWTKYEKNPVMKNFGYVGGITKKDGKYYMYNEYPTKVQASDYGHISVAVADSIEGPWEPIKDAPVLSVESWGTWDDGGYSECNAYYDGNLFHMFYGGAKTDPYRLSSRESIGYAYSVDGFHFTKYTRNPVAHREAVAFGGAMAECCFLADYPYIYIYHTLRYSESWHESEKKKYPNVEHIGVQVLSVADHYTLGYHVFGTESLAAGATYSDPDKLPLSVATADRFALTVKCTYAEDATAPVVVHLTTGATPKTFDTEDLYTFTMPLAPGKTVQKTFTGDVCAAFMKLVAENTDKKAAAADVALSIVLKN